MVILVRNERNRARFLYRFIAMILDIRKVAVLASLSLLFALVSRGDPLADGRKLKVQPVIPLEARAFELQDVRLLDGPFKHAMDLDHEYLLSLDVDRLLHNFRVNAGLPSQAKSLGGWEAPDCELRGHFVGHYMSACALMYASTGDQRLKEKADAVVAGLAACQDKLGNGYLSAFPESFIDRVEKRIPVWAPYYTLHKIFAGLQEVYLYCDNPQALDVACKFADWVIARNAKLTDEQMQAMLQTEQGGMNETLANLYAITGQEKYLKISLRFNHHRVVDPAEQQEDKLTGLHANTQIPKFIGTARQYELTGDTALRTASLFFWNTVTKERSYVIGGDSNGEMFTPKERLSQSLGPNTTETCNTYNMLKLTRHLFCWEPKAEYADYYERALYNHILASQNPETGMMCYYVPLRSGSHREYNNPTESFWCCTGTGVENHAKYGDSIYFHSDKDLYVNLFIASELTWRDKGLSLRQETSFPNAAVTELQVRCEQPVQLSLHIRHPFWATAGFEIQVNGQTQPESACGTYSVITRTWHSGDRVRVNMPFSLRTEGFKDNPNRFALLYGPLVLCAPVQPRQPFPVIVADDPTLLAGIHPVAGKIDTFTGSPDVFHLPGQASGEAVTLEPFYRAYHDHYLTYWDRYSPEQWTAKQEEFKKEMAARRDLEARTVDYIQAGEEQNERDHNLTGEHTETREFNDQVWRFANTNGWFAWDLKVVANQPLELNVEESAGRGGNELTLQVDGVEVPPSPSGVPGRGPRTRVYSLPTDLLKDKQKVTVRFQAPVHARGGSVASVRVLKPADGKP